MNVVDWDKVQPEYVTDLYRRKVASGESVALARIEAAQGCLTRPHRHEHEEIIVVLKGRWRFVLPSGEVTLGPNQILTIPAGTEYSSQALEDGVAINVCSSPRTKWPVETEPALPDDPDQWLWGV